ncbi:hypothetical protein [Lacisediminihabitans sp.]|uniref:hypothetical protein n=1 Tax=Lacisediminihabitans sp. TaxID=2787631 RepID=UPI00374D611A
MEDSTGSDQAKGVPDSVRAQLLATEHWSLLASRASTQSEVLTRISIFLTLVSAGLVSIALVGQATRFSGTFGLFASVLLIVVIVVGILTQVRVSAVSLEDLMYVLAMNRLRAAYVELDPGIAPYLMASPYDDRAGSVQTYFFLGRRRGTTQILGSSMVFIIAVNATLIGLLASSVASELGAVTAAVIAIGAAAGLAYFGASLARGGRRYFELWKTYTPLHPGPGESTPSPGE